jgi:hypothetical protein
MLKDSHKLNTRTKYVFIMALILYLCVAQALHGQIRFADITEQTGITFKHTDGSSGNRYIVESVTAGLALFDYDGDEDIDIYFLNGAPLQGAVFDSPPRNALYRNDGNWSFTDITNQSGLGDTGYGLGVTIGDYDNDGDADVYLNNYGPNVLYRNNGNGTFTDVTKSAGVGNGDKVGAGACFLDMDRDGDLDLFVSNYLKFSYAIHVPHSMMGFPQYGTPLAEHPGTGMGTVCGDYDNDGDTDIFVANDVMGNFLWRNDGMGRFEEVGLLTGVAYDYYGREQASMGADCGDYDNDGRLDFLVTSYAQELSTLYHNLEYDIFEDVTITSGAGVGTLNNVTWGNGMIDFDNDGDRDIFIASGHVQDNVENYDNRTTYRQRNTVQMNTGKGKFINVSDDCGNGMEVMLVSRGAGFDDMDNDGDIDVVVLNARTKPTILRNDSSPMGHWLRVRLQGVKTNRDGVGARVKVIAGDLTLVDEVHSGRGYQSHFGTCLHFGLGRYKKIDRIEIHWIGGKKDVFFDIAVDQSVTLVEGKT